MPSGRDEDTVGTELPQLPANSVIAGKMLPAKKIFSSCGKIPSGMLTQRLTRPES